MDNKRKATLFAILAVLFPAMTAVFAANKTASHVSIVLPLVIMAILLFISGYYAGSARKNK